MDYLYCADLILHMIEENDYLSEGIFERFKEAPEAFAAMPWFMEIYHDYKERMLEELEFEAVSIDGQSEERQEGLQEIRQAADNGQEEIQKTQQGEEKGQKGTQGTSGVAEYTEVEILNPDGSVAKPAAGSLFP